MWGTCHLTRCFAITEYDKTCNTRPSNGQAGGRSPVFIYLLRRPNWGYVQKGHCQNSDSETGVVHTHVTITCWDAMIIGCSLEVKEYMLYGDGAAKFL